MGTFDREMLLDASVNAVPLVILLVATVWMIVVSPWAMWSLGGIVALGLFLTMATLVVVVTWATAHAIEGGR